jgi:cytochrome c
MKKITLLLLSLCALHAPLAHAAAKIGDPKAGAIAFVTCASCHQVGKYAQPGFGPQLNAIIGRKAGTSAGFKYSAAMQRSNLVWTEANLAAFLRAPHDVVPGTSMRFWGIGDQQQVADLLSYMRSF